MIDKKELISTYLQQFGSHYQISRLLNPTLRIDDEFISHFFEQVVDQYGETFAITEEEKTEIERKIKSQYCIFQDEGAALVGDYEHDFMWYANLQAQEDYDEYYWPRYKAHLENKNFSPAGIDTLENKTLPKLMSYIGNPNEDSPFSIRGLVVGDVQSGKTSNYLGLITKAADAGYKVIFLLTGTIESLRRQTQKRVEEGFIGYDSVNAEDVGVGRGSRTPKAFTSRNNDFTGKNDQNTTYKINDNASEPMIFVIKKNVSVLKKLYASLKNINTSSAVSQITVPMIMIDDEADNASINTNKKDEDPTKINNYIRKILTLFARNTYVGFTATPFKDCFREDLMVIFLFSKAFYDSNICISEAGAAWATNQNCMNVVIDISFSDIEKPSNNALSSIKFQQIRTPDQTITVTEFFKTIIEEGLHFEYDESKLQKALNYVLKTDKYSDQKIDFPATFLPKRKFLPVPRCPKCHNIMLLTEENGRLKYVCSNVSCDECYEAVIN